MAKDTLAQRLIAAREKRIMSQAELARAAGVRRATVHAIEAGKVKGPPRYPTVRALALALRVDAYWLLHGDDPPDDVRDAEPGANEPQDAQPTKGEE